QLSLVAFAAAKAGVEGHPVAALLLRQLLQQQPHDQEQQQLHDQQQQQQQQQQHAVEQIGLSGLLRCIWAAATCEAQLDRLFKQAEGRLLAAAHSFDARQTATVLWAISRCIRPHRRRCGQAAAAPLRLSAAAAAAAPAPAAAAAAGDKEEPWVPPTALLEALQQRVEATFARMSNQGLCNSILALAATLGRSSEKRKSLFFLEESYQLRIARRLYSFQGEDMAALATALALTCGAPLLQQRLLYAAADAAETFSATQLAQILYCFGLLRGSSHLFASLQFCVLERLQQFSVPELCDVLWAYAIARFHDANFWAKPSGLCSLRSTLQTLQSMWLPLCSHWAITPSYGLMPRGTS
ncbi:hypothetical protein, conserved, partial [Eimeria tenella]